MKGRTNISGGGMNINANTENFTVAEGSNVVAGNFVQYKMDADDRKFDTQYGFNTYFYDSGNGAPKVIPCGLNKYVRRYRNVNETETFWFNLIDVSEGFRVLSSFSVHSEYIPSFCLLDDGNIAICYMDSANTFTIKIYSIINSFFLVNSYEFTDESADAMGATHITQLGNSKIVANRFNDCIICEYSLGEITDSRWGDLGISRDPVDSQKLYPHYEADNDWNLYATEDNKIIIFPCFAKRYSGEVYQDFYYSIYLLEMDSEIKTLDKIDDEKRYFEKGKNTSIWGNAFGIGGKILYSDGTQETYGNNDVIYGFETKIYFSQNDYVMQSSGINLFDVSKDVFKDLVPDGKRIEVNYYSNGTAQFVKENIFYVAVNPSIFYNKAETGNANFSSVDSNSRTAIYRVEYNPENGMFLTSNIVTFEGEAEKYHFGEGQFFESESGDVYYLYETSNGGGHEKEGRWLMKLTYKNGVLTMGESTGTVENYDGRGSAIGVAKQSGTAGQVIEVYTPKA